MIDTKNSGRQKSKRKRVGQKNLGSSFLDFRAGGVVVVGWLLNVPATCECISGTDLLRQFYLLPH